MKALAELLISALDLIRAEGLALRRVAFNLGITLAVVAALIGLMLVGVILLILSLFWTLEPALGAGRAAFVIGSLCVVVSGVVVWAIWQRVGARPRNE